FQNGASLLLETAFAANMKKHNDMSISLMGDQGGADVFPLGIYQEKHETLIDITPSYFPAPNMCAVDIARFVEGCLRDDLSISTGVQGLKLQKIINGLYTSAKQDQAIIL